MDLAAIGVLVVFSLIPILITWRMGKRRNRAGVWWGLLLGWLGVALLALGWPPRRD